MLLVAKIIDAFSDLLMGKIMDAGKSPKENVVLGSLEMAIPVFVMIVLLFTVPKNVRQRSIGSIRINHKYIDHSSCLHSSCNSLRSIDGYAYREL